MLAESYVLPAFLAGGRGDEAEHLGEIYEKRGKRDDAIRYYVFSLISDSPSTQGRPRLEAMGVKDVDSRMAAARPDLQSCAPFRCINRTKERRNSSC